ncbi:hypothetical protein VAWG001_06190 [Aeromonas dhakensis]|nr:hypothetical protein VAWG001_06190 [Aeromonas dhakensis]
MLKKGAHNGALIHGGGNLCRQVSCRFLVQFSLLGWSKIDATRTCGGGLEWPEMMNCSRLGTVFVRQGLFN